jgi:hypothetical protein
MRCSPPSRAACSVRPATAPSNLRHAEQIPYLALPYLPLCRASYSRSSTRVRPGTTRMLSIGPSAAFAAFSSATTAQGSPMANTEKAFFSPSRRRQTRPTEHRLKVQIAIVPDVANRPVRSQFKLL